MVSGVILKCVTSKIISKNNKANTVPNTPMFWLDKSFISYPIVPLRVPFIAPKNPNRILSQSMVYNHQNKVFISGFLSFLKKYFRSVFIKNMVYRYEKNRK